MRFGPVVLSFRAVLHISIRAEWKGTYRSCGDATRTTFLKNCRPESHRRTKCYGEEELACPITDCHVRMDKVKLSPVHIRIHVREQ